MDSQFVATMVKNGFNLVKMENYLFDVLSDFNKDFDTENTNVTCEYNYIDANTKTITSDHRDIIDLKRNIKIPYWYVIRPLRCGLPFTNLNGKPTYDAGAVANVPVNSIFLRYEPQEFVFIHATPSTQYDTYPETSYWDLLFNSLSNIMGAANNSLQSMIGANIRDCNSVIYCSMSNDFDISKDKHHKGLFSDWEKQLSHNMRFYNGLLANDQTLIKIVENEGYIEMYHQLKTKYPNRRIIFKIPNPDVYNASVKDLLNESINKNIAGEFIKELIKAPIL